MISSATFGTVNLGLSLTVDVPKHTTKIMKEVDERIPTNSGSPGIDGRELVFPGSIPGI